VAANTPPDAVVFCAKPALMYLWSDRKSVLFPFYRDPVMTDQSVARYRVTHVVEDGVSSKTRLFLRPWLADRAAVLVHAQGGTHVWRLSTSEAPRQTGDAYSGANKT